jgi:hypothetical protein
MLMEDIKARLENKANFPYEPGFNPYQIWMDAKALLNEMEYWKVRALRAEAQPLLMLDNNRY